jgi:hypothetical protein
MLQMPHRKKSSAPHETEREIITFFKCCTPCCLYLSQTGEAALEFARRHDALKLEFSDIFLRWLQSDMIVRSLLSRRLSTRYREIFKDLDILVLWRLSKDQHGRTESGK